MSIALASLAFGAFLAWLLERSQFSFDRVFRWTIVKGESEWMRAYVLTLALVWMALGLASLGPWLDPVSPVAVSPLATMIAGFVSGLAVSVLGGCPLSLALGAGQRSLKAVTALAGWVAGILIGLQGPLKPLIEWIQMAGPTEIQEVRIAELAGLPQWLLLVLCGLGVFGWLLRAPVNVSPKAQEWPKQAVGFAALTCAGWALAMSGGESGGLNGVTAVENVWTGVTGAGWEKHPSLLVGAGLIGFGFLRALRRPPQSLGTVNSIWEFVILAAASLLLGLSSALAGGCPAAHALFGVGFLNLSSTVFVLALLCGGSLMGLLEWKNLGRPGAKPSLGRGV